MQTMQQFCLRWNNHQPNFISVFTTLLTDETLVDVTLACEGKHLQAHKVVLSACSAYFQSLFTANPCQHPIVILKDIKFNDLKTMVDFMYYGEVNVSQEQLPAILKIAEMLKIKGLADMPSMSEPIPGQAGCKDVRRSVSPMSPTTKRKRLRKSSTGSGSGSTEQTSEEFTNEGITVHSPLIKAEHVDGGRALSRQSLRNSNRQISTDSEPKEGSQDSGAEDFKRQMSSESRQLSFENRQISIESRQLSHDSRQSSLESRQLSVEGLKSMVKEERQESHESRHSQESSNESGKTDTESGEGLSTFGQLKVGTKRGRLLMRQQRIKKESEVHTSPDSDPGSPGFPTMTLTIPSQPLRQRSEPTPSTQVTHSPALSTSNLLAVPQPTFPIRQHSYPSQSPPVPSGAVYIHRHSQTPTVVKCVSTSAEDGSNLKISSNSSSSATNTTTTVAAAATSNNSSPSIVMETVPIVRIFSESNLTKTNSFILQQRAEDLKSITDTPEISRSGHCPVLRAGPALGCNFCWNTIDAHGRILRRKTKYHCPECQTNLCIVPCFQQYHTTHVEGSDKTEQLSPS